MNTRTSCVEIINDGSILTPEGFLAGSDACGLKHVEGTPDIALIAGQGELSCAGVFTQNVFAAAPVRWSRSILPSDSLRAVCVNSGNANACTGERGERDAARMAGTVASCLGCSPQQVAVASTGIIGVPLPMDRVVKGLGAAYAGLSGDLSAARSAERAIMTTDTRPKSCAVSFESETGTVYVGGIAKGAGMIAPHMATMLAFITTDVSAGASDLQEMVSDAAAGTFNRITVDGDTSTNDSVFLMASGRSGVGLKVPGIREKFAEALHCVMHSLAMQLVADGEGAAKLIEVVVSGARSTSDAEKAAKAIANSLLVKCAVHGEDPNWGRIVCAAGYSGATFDPSGVDLLIGRTMLVRGGLPTGADARNELKPDRVRIEIKLGAGPGSASFWTCDLSRKYVEINAHYHT